jgi:hypothetical protein
MIVTVGIFSIGGRGWHMLYNIIYPIVSIAVFFAGLIYFGIRYKQESEKYYPLFIFLYYFISTFKLSIMLIPIPLGFIICLIYMGSHPVMKNKRAKKAAVLLGFFAFILGCIVPFAHTQMLSRERIISVSNWSADNFSFENEYKSALSSLGYSSLNGDTPSITDFRTDIDKSNIITNFSYTLKFNNSEYQSVNVRSSNTDDHKLYIIPIANNQTNYALNTSFGSFNNAYICANASMFFGELDKVKLTKLKFDDTDENDFSLSHVLVSDPDKTAEIYLIEGNSINQVVDKGQSGNILVCQGMKSTGNYSMQTVKSKNFLPFY